MCGRGGSAARPGHTFVSLFGVCTQLEISKMFPEEVGEWPFSDFIDVGVRQAKRRPPSASSHTARGWNFPSPKWRSHVPCPSV